MSVSDESGEGAHVSEASRLDADASVGPSDGEGTAGAIDETSRAATSEDAGAAKLDRKRLEEQLEVLKRKELELRRALVIADHPALADGIRVIEGRAYALGRIEAKLAQGLSKTEERRRETIEKKLASLRDKRDELEAQMTTLEEELRGLGAERLQVFEAERREALEQLLVALGTHEPALREAGIDACSLVPEIERWLPQVEALAESLVATREQSAKLLS